MSKVLVIIWSLLVVIESKKLFQCFLETSKQAAWLVQLEQTSSIDIWAHQLGLKSQFDVLVNNYEEELRLREIVRCDAKALEKEPKNGFVGAMRKQEFFQSYHSFDEILEKIHEWEELYPDFITVSSVGKSIENRDLIMMNITDKNFYGPKKVIWWNGGQHAREWISPAVVLYLAERLLVHKEEEVLDFLRRVEFVLTPLQNPDGYEYSRNKDRYWRKNRRDNGDGSFGVDLNRNWDEHWGEYGSSSNGRSETYRGMYSFSEPETRYISEWIASIPNRLAGIDFHSFGQLILRNWGWTSKESQNENILKELGDGIKAHIYKNSGVNYKSEVSAGLYPASGCTDDWISARMNMTGFTIELRDTHDFRLDPRNIIPTGEEIWSAMKYFVEFVLTRNIPPNHSN